MLGHIPIKIVDSIHSGAITNHRKEVTLFCSSLLFNIALGSHAQTRTSLAHTIRIQLTESIVLPCGASLLLIKLAEQRMKVAKVAHTNFRISTMDDPFLPSTDATQIHRSLPTLIPEAIDARLDEIDQAKLAESLQPLLHSMKEIDAETILNLERSSEGAEISPG